MSPAAEFDARTVTLELWRAVEGQHQVATMALVDTHHEQEVLERILEDTKPRVPLEAARLHYLLFTPFRYPPVSYGSRFRRPGDPGVFYGADLVRSACAELGYWRWRFLCDSPELDQLDPMPQTVFQVAVKGLTIDLRRPPLDRRRRDWTDPDDYAACQDVAARARARGIGIIRYQSVRDPEHGAAGALLTPSGFVKRKPLAFETWYLAVTRERVRWVAERGVEPGGFDFEMTGWLPVVKNVRGRRGSSRSG
jgi:hypothetical protein